MEKNNKGRIILTGIFIALVLCGFVVYRLREKKPLQDKIIPFLERSLHSLE